VGKKHEPIVCDSKRPRKGCGPGQVNRGSTILSDVQKAEGGNYSDETGGKSHSARSDSCGLNNDVLLGSDRRGKDSRE